MPISKRPRRKADDSYHHGDLRAALVAAAMAEVERAGASAISLTALATSLGVSQPAPYRHFADKDALLAAVAAEGFRAFIAVLRDSVRVPSARSPLRRMAHAYVAFGRERKGLYRLMFASQAIPQAAEKSELRDVATESFDLLLSLISTPTALEPRRRRALRIWASVHGTVMLATEGLLVEADDDKSFPDFIEDITE